MDRDRETEIKGYSGLKNRKFCLIAWLFISDQILPLGVATDTFYIFMSFVIAIGG